MTDLYVNEARRLYEKRAENGRKGAVRTAEVREAKRQTGITLHVTRTLTNDDDVPAIRFSGKWLGRLGFGQGQEITVKAEQGRITITRPSGLFERWQHYVGMEQEQGSPVTEEMLREWAESPDPRLRCVFCGRGELAMDTAFCPSCREYKGLGPDTQVAP